jgi:uncharacterized MAPEG superfamily protein
LSIPRGLGRRQGMDNPTMSLLAASTTVLGLHLIALALWTGTVRFKRETYVNPEDAVLNKAKQADVEHPDTQRVKRAHTNAIENAVPFFAIAPLYVMTGGTLTGAKAYFLTFVAARLLHSAFYLWGRQPFRTLCFGIGILCVIGMGVHVLRAAF